MPALQDFHAPEGAPWARDAIVQWLAPALGDVIANDRIVVTNGAQSGLVAVLGAIAREGDVILADAVTYQGMTNLCRTLDVTLTPVETDRGGMRPDALAAACAQLKPRALFLVPCLQNPTAVTLSPERRTSIVEIARRHDCLIVEDDVYRHLLADAPPPIATLAPERTVYVNSFSKTVAPGLRYGAVVAPPEYIGDIAAMQRVACWSISPLNALVATLLIEEGHFDALVRRQRDELRQRQAHPARAPVALRRADARRLDACVGPPARPLAIELVRRRRARTRRGRAARRGLRHRAQPGAACGARQRRRRALARRVVERDANARRAAGAAAAARSATAERALARPRCRRSKPRTRWSSAPA